MRAREFLLEYNRQITANQLGIKLLQALRNDTGNVSPALRPLKSKLWLNAAAFDELMKKLSPQEKTQMIDLVLQDIENKDPTPNKQYTQWLARMYAKGADVPLATSSSSLKIEDMNRNDLLRMFDIAKKRRMIKPEHADINRFKFYQDFEDAMEANYNNFEELDQAALPEGKAKKVYEDGNVLVVVPEDEAAACKYGRGTRWCTASTRGDNYFDAYNRQGKLYILIPKKPKYEGEKYQLHFPSKSFMDENDDPTSLYDLLTSRFPELLEYFRKVEPEINGLLPFMSDKDLQAAVEAVREIGEQYVHEVLSDWELQDDYYYDYLKEKGYTDENGDIDWDKVADADESYLEYNLEANDWLSLMYDSLSPTPQELRNIVDELIGEGELDETPEFQDLPDILGTYIENRARRRTRDGDGGLGDYLKKRVMLSGDPKVGFKAFVPSLRR